jgi:hypothetical protein
MKHLEADEQKKVIQWARISSKNVIKYPMLTMLHCSLNGVPLTASQAGRAKQQGMLRGVPDLFLPVPKNGYFGLFIEMKSAHGRPTPEQLEFLNNVGSMGYMTKICYSADEAIEVIQKYYGVTL